MKIDDLIQKLTELRKECENVDVSLWCCECEASSNVETAVFPDMVDEDERVIEWALDKDNVLIC